MEEEKIIRIPNMNEIPRGLTLFLGCNNSLDVWRSFCFWKDGKTMTIYIESGVDENYRSGLDDQLDYEFFLAVRQQAEQIKELITYRQLDFDEPEAIVIDLENNLPSGIRKPDSWRISYAQVQPYRITPPGIWPIVDEEDVVTIRCFNTEDRGGLWRGKEVDINMGWDFQWRRLLESEIEGHRALDGLDLTYEAVGLIRDVNGDISGLMTEPSFGRALQYEDYELVEAALLKVNEHGYVMNTNTFVVMISPDEKVRFRSLTSMRRITPETEDKLLTMQWGLFEHMFDELSYGPNTLPPLREFYQATTIVAAVSPPNLDQRLVWGEVCAWYRDIQQMYRDLFLRPTSRESTSAEAVSGDSEADRKSKPIRHRLLESHNSATSSSPPYTLTALIRRSKQHVRKYQPYGNQP